MAALEKDASVAAVARQHDVDPSSIYRWIRKLRLDAHDQGPTFLPVAVSPEIDPMRDRGGIGTLPPTPVLPSDSAASRSSCPAIGLSGSMRISTPVPLPAFSR